MVGLLCAVVELLFAVVELLCAVVMCAVVLFCCCVLRFAAKGWATMFDEGPLLVFARVVTTARPV